MRELVRLAERDPKKFANAVRETFDPDTELFTGHKCGPDCWHKQVPAWNPAETATELGQETLHGFIRGAARFIRRKFL